MTVPVHTALRYSCIAGFAVLLERRKSLMRRVRLPHSRNAELGGTFRCCEVSLRAFEGWTCKSNGHMSCGAADTVGVAVSAAADAVLRAFELPSCTQEVLEVSNEVV